MATLRRSRMHRTRTAKPLALTPRDFEIFRCLVRYRYLRLTHLHAFAGGVSAKRFVERLGDLFHQGFIDRPAQQWQIAKARCQPALYEIGNRVQRVLEHVGGGDLLQRTFLAPTAHRQLAHSVAICECLASIELESTEQPGLRFIPWGEILVRAPQATRASALPFRMPANGTGAAVIPDGVFGLEYRSGDEKAYRLFALEIDRGTMPVSRTDTRNTSLLGKMKAYDEVIAEQLYRTQWGVPNLLVLAVTSDAHRLADIANRAASLTAARHFLFKAMESSGSELRVPPGQFLLQSWQRPGLPPLGIAC